MRPILQNAMIEIGEATEGIDEAIEQEITEGTEQAMTEAARRRARTRASAARIRAGGSQRCTTRWRCAGRRRMGRRASLGRGE